MSLASTTDRSPVNGEVSARQVKARKKLGWEPKVKFKELVKIMVDADLTLAQHELAVKNAKAAM